MDSSAEGRPLKLDPSATSAEPGRPAFLAPPRGAPAYHGFPLIEETRVDGWVYGAITEVPEPEDGTAGDGFVVAADGARAGLVWSVGTFPTSRLIEPSVDRWGVFAIAFPRPVRTVEDLRVCFRHVLPELKSLYARYVADGRPTTSRVGAAVRTMWRRLLGPRVRREPFVVLTLRVPYGVSAEAGFLVRDTLNASRPDAWRFASPGTFHVYFRTSRSGLRRAHACRAILESLRDKDPSLANLTTTLAAGRLVASFDLRGRLTSTPMGATSETVEHLPDA